MIEGAFVVVCRRARGVKFSGHHFLWNQVGIDCRPNHDRAKRTFLDQITGDIADSKSYHFLGGHFFTEGPITLFLFTSLQFYFMGLKPSLRVNFVNFLEKFGPTVQEIWPNEDVKFSKNDPRRSIFMKFWIHAWNFETIARNGFSSHQTTRTVIFGGPGIAELQKKWAQNAKKCQKNAQNSVFFWFVGL